MLLTQIDEYTLRILCGALEERAGKYETCEEDVVKCYADPDDILTMLDKDVFPQIEKPLCGSCAGQGICIMCNEDHVDKSGGE